MDLPGNRLVVSHHQLHDHVSVLVLASKERLERLVDLVQREAGGDELLDAGQSAGAKESKGVGVGVAADEVISMLFEEMGRAKDSRVAEDSEKVDLAESGG